MGARGWLALLTCSAALLALPADAPAKPGYYVSSAHRSASIDLRGSHGYSIYISGSAGSFDVLVAKENASVIYFLFREGLHGDRLRGRLPGVGWAHLRFKELKRLHRPPEKFCTGPATLVRRGVFEGWIRIRGEGGYTRVETHRARGKIVQEPETTCRARPVARLSAEPAETISAEARRGKGFLGFRAYRLPFLGLDDVFFNSSLLRRRGRMVIINSSYALAEDAESLSVDQPPRSATVDPPGPFTGTAAFQQESKDAFSWTGDLAVELLGIGEVNLAGPRWKSALCVGRHCRGDAEGGKPISIVTVFSHGRSAIAMSGPWPALGEVAGRALAAVQRIE